MVIQIPDDLYLAYQDASRKAGTQLRPETLITKTLERALPAAGHGRWLLLSGEPLAKVDRLLGIGSTKDPETFLTKVQEYAGISIGGIVLDFTPAQKAEIAHRAGRQGKSPEQVVQEIVAQLSEQFFWEGTPTR